MKASALQEFESLKKNELYSIVTIKEWLEEYNSFYTILEVNWFCNGIGCDYKNTANCTCEDKNEAYIFMRLYEKLSEFIKFHDYEDYARNELFKYEDIKNDLGKLKEWIKRNEVFGAYDCFEFLIYHFDYAINPDHLLVIDASLLGYDVFVEGQDLKNLVEFLHVFNMLFWVKRIYPQSKYLHNFDTYFQHGFSKN